MKYLKFPTINDLSISPESLYLIDDVLINCKCCKKLGCNCILVSKECENEEVITVKSLKDVLNLLTKR